MNHPFPAQVLDLPVALGADEARGAATPPEAPRPAEEETAPEEGTAVEAEVRPAESEGARDRGRSGARDESVRRSKRSSRSRSKSRTRVRGSMDRATFVVKAKGAVVRSGVELGSDRVTKLDAGTAVVVDFAEDTSDGKCRYRVVAPAAGWVSATSLSRQKAD